MSYLGVVGEPSFDVELRHDHHMSKKPVFCIMVALPTDKTFAFGPTKFGRMAEIWAVPVLLYGNWSDL